MQPTRSETSVGSLRTSTAASGAASLAMRTSSAPVGAVPVTALQQARRLPHLLVVGSGIEAGEVRAADVARVQELVDVRVRIDVAGLPEPEREVPLLSGGRELREVRRRCRVERDATHLDVETDHGELSLDELPQRQRQPRAVRVEHGLSTAEVAPGERPRPVRIRTLERVDVRVLEAGQVGGRYWSLGMLASGPPAPLMISRRLRAKFTALRRLGLSRNSGRAELKASSRRVNPGLMKNRERLIPYFPTSPRVESR